MKKYVKYKWKTDIKRKDRSLKSPGFILFPQMSNVRFFLRM